MYASDVGTLALRLGWCLALWGIFAAVLGAVRLRREMVESGRQAAFAVFGCVAVASAALWHGLLTRDFNIEYVASYSSSTLPLHYTIAALWGGMAGSLVFWALILCGATVITLVQSRERHGRLMPWVNATLLTITLFFLSLLVFVVPPFARLSFTPADGSDLNPLLQNYWMMIHPP
ncbi:MAG: cytochrome c biogenesis protein CcsA, partial [Candidatus Binatia bacterium]